MTADEADSLGGGEGGKPRETGLRHRLRRAVRQIATQHENLRAAHRAVADAAEGRGARDLAATLDQLAGAVDAHFSLEEQVFFPALHGLHAESGGALQELVEEHRSLHTELAALRTMHGPELRAVFLERYRAFASATADHEAREERLLTSLAHLYTGGG